jgi:acetamidase/formamidase
VLHELPLEQASLHGYFSRELEPVLTIDPGDSVRLSVPNAGWELESRERLASRSPELDTGHALAGPIEVRGAREGQTLVVGIDDVAPGSWGVTLSEPPHRIDWELDGEIGRGRSSGSRGFEVRLAPILGVLGMPPAEAGVHSTIPPRRFGGALFSAGDGHAAQGDGEVSGTAIECPASAQLTLDVRDDLSLEWPVARIDGAWLTFGFDPHLGHAARIAVDGMLDLLEREHGIDRSDALALCSVVVDLHVTQVVNDVLGVHAILRDDAFAR